MKAVVGLRLSRVLTQKDKLYVLLKNLGIPVIDIKETRLAA